MTGLKVYSIVLQALAIVAGVWFAIVAYHWITG